MIRIEFDETKIMALDLKNLLHALYTIENRLEYDCPSVSKTIDKLQELLKLQEEK